jgi:hypothetical protein
MNLKIDYAVEKMKRKIPAQYYNSKTAKFARGKE